MEVHRTTRPVKFGKTPALTIVGASGGRVGSLGGIVLHWQRVESCGGVAGDVLGPSAGLAAGVSPVFHLFSPLLDHGSGVSAFPFFARFEDERNLFRLDSHFKHVDFELGVDLGLSGSAPLEGDDGGENG
jgi:hypothetical protein